MDSSLNHSHNSSILDLSQRTTTNSIDNWTNDCRPCLYSDTIQNEFVRIESTQTFNIEHSLTDQYQNISIKDDSLSDSSNIQQSKLDVEQLLIHKSTRSPTYRIRINELEPCQDSSPYNSSHFLWSKYLSILNERSVSDEFFDHYLSSIHSGLEIDMKLEYCYDIQRDLYWLTQIQLVSHCLVYLHYIGIPDDETSNDFWTNIYDQRCHPIGWCKEHSKLMIPPPILTKRLAQQTTIPALNNNGLDKHLIKNENEQIQTPKDYLFRKDVGLNPIEQLKIGMLLEIQDIDCPWTVWFVRIINNRGGRLHLRYVTSKNIDELTKDIHIFYLDWRVHPIGWIESNPAIYSYDYPKCLSISTDDNKQELIDFCLNLSKEQYLPENLFQDQEQIRSHRFQQGNQLEVFDEQSQMIYVGQIGQIYNEFYFDILIDNEYQTKFIGHATHPFILPAHWAAEHRFALMKGKAIRQSEDYWNVYREKNDENHLAADRCFHLITLNSTGNNRIEPGMKMERILTIQNQDLVVSATLIHVADHLMWLRIENQMLNHGDIRIYHVLPINSLDVFPVGWAKFNQFEFIPPIDYQTKIRTFEQNQYDLFSSVTNYPKIPRIYLNEIYQLTLFINIRCFSGPNFCSSRLARIPSQFGPGPYEHVLIDMFHHLLSTTSTSTNTLRALRRLEHSSNTNFQTQYIKAAKRASKLIRPISLPKDPRLIYHYLRMICTQLEACPNLISMKHFEHKCPDKCFILTNTFAHSFHSKHKRTQLRTAQNRQRKQKSLLCLLKPNTLPETAANPNTVESSSNIEEASPTEVGNDDASPTSTSAPIPQPPAGSDRKTRGFRVHIEPRTHTVTRTNRKQKITIKQEPEQVQETIPDSSSSISSTIRESKRSRLGKSKRAPSPVVTMNILSNPVSPGNKIKKKRRSSPIDNTLPTSSTTDLLIPKIESAPLAYPIPLINTQNPVTWNVNDVCSYLNQSGCSFALKTIQEQEIDGAALLLLDDLPKVQDLLEFKLGPAVKFCHVVEQLRTQVIDTFHSSPSLKTPSRLSTTNTS